MVRCRVAWATKRRRNDVLLELRNRPGLIDALQDLGLSRKTAETIADAFPDGRGLDTASVKALEHLGATTAQAKRVVAAFQVVRLCDESCRKRARYEAVKSPDDLVGLLHSAIGRREQEWFAVVLLDPKLRVMDILGVGVGSLSKVDVHPREVFTEAVRRKAHAIIVAHNHPVGRTEPSDADIALTERLWAAGQLFGIPLLDHLIMTRDDFRSLASMGLVRGQE